MRRIILDDANRTMRNGFSGFDFPCGGGGGSAVIPEGYNFYRWNTDDGNSNLGDWVEKAAKAGNRCVFLRQERQPSWSAFLLEAIRLSNQSSTSRRLGDLVGRFRPLAMHKKARRWTGHI